MSKDMAEMKTYKGGCHCKKVTYEVTTDLGMVISCNCSICSKRGSLLTFVGEPQFKLLSGEGATTDYQFNKHIIHHRFCSTCGILSYANGVSPDGKPVVAVNVRCLDDVDPKSLTLTEYDGKNR
jgi:hypothetical protein